MERLPRRTAVWKRNSLLWIPTFVFVVAAVKAETSHPHSSLGISFPHLFYTCPEGATAKLECIQKADSAYSLDVLKHSWLFTPHSDQVCKRGIGPRHILLNHPHANATSHEGVQYGQTKENIWLVLKNITSEDQGRYCCKAFHSKNHSPHLKSHSYIVLHVTPRRKGAQNCSVWEPAPPGGTVPVALALAACILALLSLPLILVLVYKQRQNAQLNRRAQELVRMDSEAQGHENPVFLGGSPQIKTRTVSQIMTRQSSETGCHLLSDPGTPLSPPAHGDVFFPSEDAIPESPDLLQV